MLRAITKVLAATLGLAGGLGHAFGWIDVQAATFAVAEGAFLLVLAGTLDREGM